jgi:hypothetical protein
LLAVGNRAYKRHEVGLCRLFMQRFLAGEELALSLPKGRLRALVAAISIAGVAKV